MKKRIIFIDSRVLDFETLIRNDAPDTSYVILDPDRSGIDQIQAALAETSELHSIHIISHGSAGSITIGNTLLNSQTLPSYHTNSQQSATHWQTTETCSSTAATSPKAAKASNLSKPSPKSPEPM